MARNLWKVIQKQEKKIEELESIVAALQLRITCLEARDARLVPYKYPDFDKFNDKDWWRNQPVMALQPLEKGGTKPPELDPEELRRTMETIQLANKLKGGKK